MELSSSTVIVSLIIAVGLAIVVYIDASKRTGVSPILWAILTFLFLPLVVVYLIIRFTSSKPKQQTQVVTTTTAPTAPAGNVVFCKSCGTKNTTDAKFCASCGKQIN